MAGPFRVVHSQAVLEKFREIRSAASTEGRRQAVDEAAAAIISKLETDPLTFGEPLFELVHLELQMRVALEGILAVIFGVHVGRRLVFVQDYRLLM